LCQRDSNEPSPKLRRASADSGVARDRASPPGPQPLPGCEARAQLSAQVSASLRGPQLKTRSLLPDHTPEILDGPSSRYYNGSQVPISQTDSWDSAAVATFCGSSAL